MVVRLEKIFACPVPKPIAYSTGYVGGEAARVSEKGILTKFDHILVVVPKGVGSTVNLSEFYEHAVVLCEGLGAVTVIYGGLPHPDRNGAREDVVLVVNDCKI